MKKLIPGAAALLAVAFLAAPAALAGSDHEGFYVLADAMMATPGNTDTAIISEGRNPGGVASDIQGETVWMEDWDDDFTYSIGFGYSWGEKGRLQVTYWDYSDEASTDGTVGGSSKWTFFNIGPAATVGDSWDFPAEYDFTQEIEATALDVEFLRTTKLNSPVTIDWGVGARLLSFEDTTEGVYRMVGPPFSFPASRLIETDAFGLSGTVGVGYGFTDRYGLSTSMRVGFLISDVDTESTITDPNGWGNAPGVTYSREAGSEDGVGTTLDFNVSFDIHINDSFDIDVGWFFTTWSELADGQLERDVVLGGGPPSGGVDLPGEDRDRISWSGFRVAGVWRFGR